MNFCKILYPTILCVGLFFNIQPVKAQAKNAIGLGPAINASTSGSGFGAVFQGEIKLAKMASLVPSIGVEVPYTGYISLQGKYYVMNRMHVNLGAFLNLGGDDAEDSGPGGTVGFGFEIVSSRRHVLDLDFHGDVFNIQGKASPLGGIRLTYNFSFSKR